MKKTAGGLHGQVLAGAAVALLAGCGGGGDAAPASAATPVTGPTPVPPVTGNPAVTAPPVLIFANPGVQEYAVAGVSTPDAGDGYEPIAANARLHNLLFGPSDQPRLRYSAAGQYELQLPGTAWDTLVHYKGLLNPAPDNNFFQPQGVAQNAATLIISRSRLDGYVHSELASWSAAPSGVGTFAFGTPTAAAALPVAGRATYRGAVEGIVDVTYYDQLYGGYYFERIVGTVTLDVDFASRTATVSLELSLRGTVAPIRIGSYTSAPMALPSSANGFSGLVNVIESGFNRVDGLFTGPTANEAIGRFALPVSINGTPHQVMGAWIAATP